MKKSFPSDVILKLYYTLIYPHLNYCILAWGSAKQTYLHPLLVLQKRVVRIVTDSHYYAHSLPLFKQLNLLRLDDMYMLSCRIHAYITLGSDKYPKLREAIINLQIQHDYRTRSLNLRNIYCRINVCKQSLIYNIINAWNMLHVDLKMIIPQSAFKNACKINMLSYY